MDDVDVVGLLVAVEQVLAEHRADLDALNVFPVPDADTGRNVLATVRAARAAAEEASDPDRAGGAVDAAVRDARGNAGVLISQVLRALLADGHGDWAARLGRADDLARSTVAEPVEGTLLTALAAAATAAGAHGDPAAQLAAAIAAAHDAVAATPGQLEVLARAGVVDAGARAVALVLEGVAAAVTGRPPTPPPVDVPVDGPPLADCGTSSLRFEVMYLLAPVPSGRLGPDVVDALRTGLASVGDSLMVAAAGPRVSVHVHTDDIGAALEHGLRHGHPHHVRVEDLHAAVATGQARPQHPAGGAGAPTDTALVVGAAGEGLARLAAASGATTVPVDADGCLSPAALEAAVRRADRSRVLVLPGCSWLGPPDVAGVEVVVATAVDDPARLVAALAVLEAAAPDAGAANAAAEAVRTASVTPSGDGWQVAIAGRRVGTAATTLGALDLAVGHLEAVGPPELVSLLFGGDLAVEDGAAAAAALERQWPAADIDTIDAGLRHAALVVGVE